MKRLIAVLCGSSLCFLFGCQQQDQQALKQIQDNIKIAKDAASSGFTQHDTAKAASYYTDDAISTDYAFPKPDTGKAAIQQRIQQFITAFPEGKLEFEGEVAHGDMVTLRWRGTGTNTGPFMGGPPTNKAVEVHGATVSQIANGKITREWIYWDMGNFMRQLGMMPQPGEPASAKKQMKK